MATVKIGPEIQKQLYARVTRLAKANGQSVRYILEKALQHYLRFIAPTQNTIRPEAMAIFRRSVERNKGLYRALAGKSKAREPRAVR